MAVKISPTLIIGIGSSGLEIINAVRELLYEEIGYAGLPLVRFVHITTHTGGEGITSLPNEQFADDWQQIRILEASIGKDRYQQVRLKLRPDHHMHENGLSEWLNPNIAEIPDATFEDGAGNLRQAGRLCLWTNWNRIIDGINAIIGQMSHQNAKAETSLIIRDYLKRKNPMYDEQVSFVSDQKLRAFVAGSTVGGTCSGIFIDLGYYLREEHQAFKTYAVFTTMDSSLAARPASDRRAANAYAAAIELDFYSQQGTVFTNSFPNTTHAVKNDDIPYNNVSILSTKNKDGSISPIVDEAGLPDLASLHKMIGMSIFFDVFGGADSVKEGIKIDFVARGGVLPRVKTKPEYVKFFSSFGATALWFPKSRISGAAAARVIKVLGRRWRGSNITNQGKLEALLESFKGSLLSQLRTQMSHFYDINGEQTTVAAHWNEQLEFVRGQMTSKGQTVQNVLHLLRSHPDDSPLAARFKLNGFYFKKLEHNLPYMQENFFKIVSEIFENQVRSIFSQFDDDRKNLTFNDLNHLVDKVYEMVENYSKEYYNLNDRDFDFSELEPNFAALRTEQSRVLTKMIGVRDRVIQQHHIRIYDKLKNIFENESDYLIDHFLIKLFRQVLPDLRQKLTTVFQNYLNKLEEIIARAEQVETDLSQVTSQSSLKMLSQSDSIANDIDKYYSKLNSDRLKVLIEPIDLRTRFQVDGSQVLFGKMMAILQKEILNDRELAQFDIIQTVQQREPDTIEQFARNAQPMLEFSNEYQPVELPTKPTLIAGGKKQSRQTLINQLRRNNSGFDREMDIDLDHLLYFYREESLIAISEMKAFKVWQEQYRRLSETDKFGSHISKDPKIFDVDTFHVMREIDEGKWLKVSQNLFQQEMFESSSNNSDFLVFRYKNEYDEERRLSFDTKNPKIFIETLAKNKHALDTFRNRFHQNFSFLDRQGVSQRISEYLNRLEENGWSIHENDYKKEDEFYQNLLNEKFPVKNV